MHAFHIHISRLHVHVTVTRACYVYIHCYTYMSCLHITVTHACHVSLWHMLISFTSLYVWYLLVLNWYICLGLCDILHILIPYLFITCLILVVLTQVLNQESYNSTSILNLEESWGDSLEPFTGNSASLFGYTLCVILVCK